MLPPEYRLRKDKDFQSLFNEGTTFSYRFLYFRVKKNLLNQTRFGFIVSKKVSRKAVIRNKIKRKLRALVRERLSKIKKGFDIAIVVNPTFKMVNFGSIEEVIEILFKKADVYRKIG